MSVATCGEPLTYSVDQVARLLGVSRTAVYDAINDGQLPHIRIRSRILVPRRAIDRMLEEQPGEAA